MISLPTCFVGLLMSSSMPRVLLMRFMRKCRWFLKVSKLIRSCQKIRSRRQMAKMRIWKQISSQPCLTCSARPLQLLIPVHMEVSLFLVELLRTASLPWIIISRGPHKSSLQKTCMDWNGDFGTFIGDNRGGIYSPLDGVLLLIRRSSSQEMLCFFLGYKFPLSEALINYPTGILFTVYGRGEDGELRLGIRRAAQIKNGASFPSLCSQQLNRSTFADVVHAISIKSVFSIYYNPRASSSECIIPLQKFRKSLNHTFSVGMRFKMRFETEDAAERRYTGLVTGISDMDPVRWPGSKWRCLLVRWDDIDTNRHSRVSPWEIEPSGSVSSSNNLLPHGSKRNRVGLPSGKPEFMVPDGIGASFGESLRFQKVLQGQEILGFKTLYDGADCQNMHRADVRRCFLGSNGSGIAAIGNVGRDPSVNPDISNKGVGFGESFRFHKVLQGQEILVKPLYRRGPTADETRENDTPAVSDAGHLSGTRSAWSSLLQGSTSCSHIRPSAQVSSPSSVLMFQQASNSIPNSNPVHNFNSLDKEQGLDKRNLFHPPETYGGKLLSSSTGRNNSRGSDLGSLDSFVHSNGSAHLGDSQPLAAQPTFRTSQEIASSCKSSCRLFGFSLTEGSHDATKEDDMVQATSSLAPGAFLPRIGEPFHPKPPAVTNTVGSNCTKGIMQQSLKNYDIY
ncbi:hypothetical protein PTKIN_Ptkin01aG0112400 [Pterospermum kingtungense]